MTLRRWLIVLGVVDVAVAVMLLLAGVPLVAGIYLLFTGVLLVGALVFERRGYRPKVSPDAGEWRATGERFIDPTSGRLMEVRYNPKTGERDYVDLGPRRL